MEEPESAYKEVKKDVTDLTATIGNLSEGKIYHIKVVAKNEKGEDELVVIEAIQQLVKTITLDKTTATMKPDDTLQLTATVLPENAENKILEWTSSNESIATVSNTGLVTAKVVGNVSITAKATDGSEVTASCNITVKIPVESVSLNKTSAQIDDYDTTVQLTATVLPNNATNKTVTWSSSNTNVATVDQNGLVTQKAEGTTIITATSNDDATKKASCTVTVVDFWAYMDRIAKSIAKDSNITINSTQASGTTERGEQYSVKVGNIYKLRYNGEIRRVRVLGFKHDDLVNTGVYGGSHTKASISFEFLDFMTGDTYMPMNASNTNSGGWASTKLRTDLNGSGSSIGGLGANLNNKSYIKQVKKKYIPTYNVASTSTCNDYLWLLAASEIVARNSTSALYGLAITSEGSRYRYYQLENPVHNQENTILMKKSTNSGVGEIWWLRSPYATNNSGFCNVMSDGKVNNFGLGTNPRGIAPGFCI